MIFGSLFSGIDGFAEGLEKAGMELRWQVEINEYCLKILKQDWPDVPKFKDIRDVGKHNLEAVDLICGGFPCQPFSVAGKRKGKNDDRYLWPEMLRVIQEIRPKWVFAENVIGILHIDDGLVIEQVLSSLENEGYETLPPLVIPACAVDAHQYRRRIYILAYSDGKGLEGIFKKSDTFNLRPAPRIVWRKWEAEPSICRVATRFPNRKDRIEALGNAVVPQVVEMIGRCIMQAESKEQPCTNSSAVQL